MQFDDEVQRLEFYLKECEEENKKLNEKVERYEKALKVISENANWVGKGKVDTHIRNVGGIALLTLKK